MSTESPPPPYRDPRRDAKMLLKSLRSDDPERARQAAERFQQHPTFRYEPLDDIIDAADVLQHKHALDVIARELGYVDWKSAAKDFPASN